MLVWHDLVYYKKINGHYVLLFTVDNQTLHFNYRADTEEEAKWYKAQIIKALETLVEKCNAHK